MDEARDRSLRQDEASAMQRAEVRRVTWVGLCANLALAALKFFAGIVGHSQVIVADAIHTLSDSGTDIAVLVGVRFWSKPPDDSHPHGHRRIETLVTLVIAGVLAVTAVGLAYNALATLQHEDISHPTWIAFAAAAVSIVIKEWLYRWTAAAGRRIKSLAVIANAWHHRSDGLSSIPAAIAVATAAIVPSWAFVDHVGAVLVSGLILYGAGSIGWPALKHLADVGAPEAQRRKIQQTTLATDGVRAVHAVRTRYSGAGIQVDLHILVDPEMSVRDGHRISGMVKERLMAIESGPDVLDVVVHIEPYEGPLPA